MVFYVLQSEIQSIQLNTQTKNKRTHKHGHVDRAVAWAGAWPRREGNCSSDSDRRIVAWLRRDNFVIPSSRISFLLISIQLTTWSSENLRNEEISESSPSYENLSFE